MAPSPASSQRRLPTIGCCEDAAGELVPELSKLLPNARVVTVSQVVQTQVGVNRLMSGTSWFVLGILVVVGGASLASAMAANVRERRREIGTLMAIGATPGFVQRLFLMKALVLGLVAGTIGCLVGLLTAVLIGPQWAGVSVVPLPGLAVVAVAGIGSGGRCCSDNAGRLRRVLAGSSGSKA